MLRVYMRVHDSRFVYGCDYLLDLVMLRYGRVSN